ncbi:MAG TPA: ABC transporter ATP-binding protein, partial [Thermomicrobiales bacterium]|nr:ABC transporter ATP-binding protein [Thermomicrobiales bacterium]
MQTEMRPTSKQPGAVDNPLLSIRDLHIEYATDGDPVKAVDGVSFDIAPGEVFGLAGESGSGKSTVAHGILRLLQPPAVITGGEVNFKGHDIFALTDKQLAQFRWPEISMVMQSAMNALNPVMTVCDQIVDAIRSHDDKRSRSSCVGRAKELFKIVGIDPDRVTAYPHELSGGMRQRAMIAMALALDPPMMIMDEPTTALDVVVQKEIMQEIEDLKAKLGFSILFITHDLSLLVEFSDRIAIMYAGKIVELAPAQTLFDNPLHPYTLGLMSSFPTLTGPKKHLTGIPGSPPDMACPPSGCRFHPRCPKFAPMHAQVEPELVEVEP